MASQRSIVTANYHHFTDERASAENFFAWAERSGKLSLEKAIAKMTGLPAAKYSMERRGLIKDGYAADIVFWENWKPKTVMINGSAAMRNGASERKLVGSVLKAG